MINKKVIGILVSVIILVIGVSAYLLINKDIKKESSSSSNSVSNNQSNLEEDEKDSSSSKVLVVYFSAQNHTKEVAGKIADNLNADTFEIVPIDKYTSEDLDWTNNNSRVSKEHDDESLRDIKLVSTKVDGWDNYDTILIGYPIWWGIAAWPVNNFIKENNFDGKRVYPFCTSASSGLGESAKLLEELSTGGNWQEGTRFNSNPTDADIKSFIDSIK